jgi:tetratricopeptide (TPR) repeat protein
LLLTLFLAAAASAEESVPVAQAHFARGAQLYATQRYAEAIDEFEEARRYAPLPAFDYNIARCQERLGHNRAAIAAYERYLGSNPSDAMEIRRHVSLLRGPVPSLPAEPVAPAPPAPAEAVTPPRQDDSRRPLRIGAGVLLGGGLTLLASGLGLTLSVGPAIDDLMPTCAMRQCGPADTDGLHQRLDAGWALLAIGGAALVADVALFVVAARRPPRPLRAERSW